MASTDVAVIGGGLSLLHTVEYLAKAGVKVTACMGNPFLEFGIASCLFLADPSKHSAWTAEPSAFKLPGVDYVFDAVTRIDPEAKAITFGSSPPLTYRAVIIATGSRLPLFYPKPGATLAQRRAELEEVGRAVACARTVVLNGSGTVGVELAGDIKANHPQVEVVLLARSGSVLNGDPLPKEAVSAVSKRLREIGVRVVHGAAPAEAEWLEVKLSSGTVPLSGGQASEQAFDVYIPTFAQRPNTQFLEHTRALDDRKLIVANECLQSTVYPEIFGINTTDQKLLGHPVTSRLTAQAKTCATNAQRLLRGESPIAHVDKEMPPVGDIPMNIKVGHGPNGYVYWNKSVIPPPLRICCCMPCAGGFPFCPPPCCWCIPGCSGVCGNCGGAPAGRGAAVFLESVVLPKAAGMNGYKGVSGKPSPMAPPQPQEGFLK